MKWKKFKAKKSMDKLHKIYVERDSVCMGDDCNAPNAKELYYGDHDRLSDFMIEVANYVPAMRNVVWSVACADEIIAYLIFDDDSGCKYELEIQDIKVSELVEQKIYCAYYYESKFYDYRTKPPADLYPQCKTLLDKVRLMNDDI